MGEAGRLAGQDPHPGRPQSGHNMLSQPSLHTLIVQPNWSSQQLPNTSKPSCTLFPLHQHPPSHLPPSHVTPEAQCKHHLLLQEGLSTALTWQAASTGSIKR